MMLHECNNSDHDNVQLFEQPPERSQLPDHLKCGEVYTWLCEGELYAVECKLCEDRPLCPLSEFPQHMEIWHTEWERSKEGDEEDSQDSEDHFNYDDDNEDQENYDVNDEDLQLSFTTEDSGLYGEEDFTQDEIQDEIQDVNQHFFLRVASEEEILEPFEQVLIEQDNNTDSIQINDESGEEEKTEEKTEDCQLKLAINNGQQQNQQQQHKPDHELQKLNKSSLKESSKQKELIRELRKHGKNVNKAKRNEEKEREVRDDTKNEKELRETKIMKNERDLDKLNLRKRKHFKSKNSKTARKFCKIKRIKKREIKTKSEIKKVLKKSKRDAEPSFAECKEPKEAENDDQLKIENYNMDIFSKSSKLKPERVSLRQSKRKLRDILSTTKEKKKNFTKNQTNLEYQENSECLREDLKITQTNSKSSKENLTKNRKYQLREQKKNPRYITQEEHKFESDYDKNSDLEKTLFDKCEEKMENCVKEDPTNTRKSVERVQRRKTRAFYSEIEEKDIFKDELKNVNKIFQTKLKESLNSLKTKENTITPSLRERKRKTVTPFDSKKCLLTNEDNNSEKEHEFSTSNLKKSDNSSESNAKSNKLSLRAIEKRSIVQSDIEKCFMTNEDDNISEIAATLKQFSTSILKESSESNTKNNKPSLRDKTTSPCDLEKSLLTNEEDNISEIATSLKKEISAPNLKESENSSEGKTKINKLSLRDKIRKTKAILTETLCDLEKSLFTNEEDRSTILRGRKKKPNEIKGKTEETKLKTANLAKDTHNESNLELELYSLPSLKENSYQKRKFLQRKSKPQKRLYIKDRKKLAKTSLDLEKSSVSALTKENLKSQDLDFLRKAQENLNISTNNQEFDKKSSTDVSNATTLNIYDLLSAKTLENPTTSFSNSHSSSSFSPASLTSGDMNTSTQFKQNPNNLFDSSQPFKEQVLKPPSPQSPKTEEEHFEFYEPREKLTKHHIIKLIALYKDQPRLWDQSHPQFFESQLGRVSWQAITDKWNEYCQRKFTTTEVRIRICTLCQRYLKERERLVAEGELDESAKFSYYEQMRFLEQQKSLQKRSALYEQQNEKVLEMYQHFPVLWHVGGFNQRQASERAKALQSISTALKLCGIHLSTQAVQKRIRSLRKCYRLDKIRYLHCQVEQTSFEASFKHFERMQFLDKHIDPFVCRICGKIFEHLAGYREHLEVENHGSLVEEESESESENDNESSFEITESNIIETDVSQQSLVSGTKSLTSFPTEAGITDNSASIQTPTALEDRFESVPYINEVTLTSYSPVINEVPFINEVILTSSSPIINEVLIYSPLTTEEEPTLSSLPLEDQMIEEIIENVGNDNSFTAQSLDKFLNSVNNNEGVSLNNCIASESLPDYFMDYSNHSVQNEIVIDQTLDLETPNCNEESSVELRQNQIEEYQKECVNKYRGESGSMEITNSNAARDIIPTVLNEHQELPATFMDYSNHSVQNEIVIDQTLVTEISNCNGDQNILTSQQNQIRQYYEECVDREINNMNNSNDISDLKSTVMDEQQELPAPFMDYSNHSVQNEIVIDQLLVMESTNCSDQNIVVEQQNQMEEYQEEYSDGEINPRKLTNSNDATDMNPSVIEKHHEPCNTRTENNSPSPFVVKVQCADYSLDLNLNAEPQKVTKIQNLDCDEDFEFDSAEIDGIFAKLPTEDIRKMIAVYRKYPQLWNPNHLDFNSRNLRRQAWCSLTTECNNLLDRQFSWRTVHRKLMDYGKYYKKLFLENRDCGEVDTKWALYKDFAFLDDVIAVHDELLRSVHHRDNNFKIIGIYRSLPQLWDIKHPDYNKRPIKQRNIELMCNRLQEEYNLQITPERLKTRLIELRAQYRAVKKQRLKALKLQQIFRPDFEFYEALLFIDLHIDPFTCEHCKEEFKKLTDFNYHVRKKHEKKKILRQNPLSLQDHKEGEDQKLANVCHICGIKFTTRSNLVHHVKRHEGVKNYECTLCTKKFFTSHSLKIHKRSHTKECPYTCEKCGASFVSSSKLNQHAKRHTNKKDFQCDYCPKAFYTAFEMERHVRRHLNIRDKICPICGKSFVVGSSYYAHMMLHNDTKRFACDKCDMKFAQYAGLYKHKKRHHKS